MSNAVVRAEFESRLKTWADAQNPRVPVAFEAAPFTKPSDGVYVEAFLLPNNTLSKEVSGSRKTFIGLFQINCWARAGKGMGQLERLAQSVIDIYPMLPKTGAVSVESVPSADKPIQDGSGWLSIPVTVRYRMETI